MYYNQTIASRFPFRFEQIGCLTVIVILTLPGKIKIDISNIKLCLNLNI